MVEISREGTDEGGGLLFKVENFSRVIVGYPVSPRLEFLACQFFLVSDRGSSLYLDPRSLTNHPRARVIVRIL